MEVCYFHRSLSNPREFFPKCPGGTLITKAAFIQESRVGILILISMSSVETDPSHQIEYGFQEDFLSISFSDYKDVVMDGN